MMLTSRSYLTSPVPTPQTTFNAGGDRLSFDVYPSHTLAPLNSVMGLYAFARLDYQRGYELLCVDCTQNCGAEMGRLQRQLADAQRLGFTHILVCEQHNMSRCQHLAKLMQYQYSVPVR